MLVAKILTNRPDMSKTRTFEDFSKFLGERPHRMGVVSRMHPELTATFLTEALRNVYYGDAKKGNKFNPIDSTYYEWEVETNHIKRVPMVAEPVGSGVNGSEIDFFFEENYYQIHEVFKIEDSGQLVFVTTTPIRLADNMWQVTGQLMDDDYSSILDTDACYVGSTTRFLGNLKPELHETGKIILWYIMLPVSAMLIV